MATSTSTSTSTSPNQSAVRYSQPNAEAVKNFSWEYPVPDNEFWNSLDYPTGRNFLTCFSTEEIEHMHLDGSLSNPEKLELLLKLLKDKLASEDVKAAPQILYDVNGKAWETLWLAIGTMQGHLGQHEEEEKTLRLLIEKRVDKENLSHPHNLAGVLESTGRYAEAEEIEIPVLVWLENKPGLSPHAPQVFSSRRILIRSIWKQGRQAEAQKKISELFDLIEASREGKFAVYADEEKKTTEDMVEQLEKWIVPESGSD